MNKIDSLGTSLAVQWLRLLPANAGGVSSVPSPGTKIHPPPPATGCSQKKKKKKRKLKKETKCTVLPS